MHSDIAVSFVNVLHDGTL